MCGFDPMNPDGPHECASAKLQRELARKLMEDMFIDKQLLEALKHVEELYMAEHWTKNG